MFFRETRSLGGTEKSGKDKTKTELGQTTLVLLSSKNKKKGQKHDGKEGQVKRRRDMLSIGYLLTRF